jgi:hypothetical protein
VDDGDEEDPIKLLRENDTGKLSGQPSNACSVGILAGASNDVRMIHSDSAPGHKRKRNQHTSSTASNETVSQPDLEFPADVPDNSALGFRLRLVSARQFRWGDIRPRKFAVGLKEDFITSRIPSSQVASNTAVSSPRSRRTFERPVPGNPSREHIGEPPLEKRDIGLLVVCCRDRKLP